MNIEQIIAIVGGVVGIIGSIVSIILKVRADRKEEKKKEISQSDSVAEKQKGELTYLPDKKHKDTSIQYPDSIPNNMPPRRQFIGRESKRHEIHQTLLHSRPSTVIIHGLGGIGKTSLALEIAYDCFLASIGEASLSTIKTFDSIVWATARNSDLSLNNFLDIIARVLGQPGILQQELEDKKIAIQELLQEKRCLLIVDNFETIVDENLPIFLNDLPSNTSLIMTTREKKQIVDDGRLITIEKMSLGEATELIRAEGDRLGLDGLVNAETETVQKLYQATGGAPLALKWAVGQIKRRGQPVHVVLDDLSTATGDIFEKIFDRSWKILSEDAKKILCIASMFAAPASFDALAAASQWNVTRFKNAVGQLVEISFLELSDELDEHPRYGLHPLTRVFAQIKLDETPSLFGQAVEKLADYYIKFTKQFKNWRSENAEPQIVEKEIQNIYRVIHYCLDIGLLEQAFELLQNPSHFIFTRGYWIDALTISHQVLDKLNDAINANDKRKQDFEIMKAVIMTWPISSIIRHRGDLETALDYSMQSLKILEHYSGIRNDAFVLRHLGRIEHERKNYIEAEQYLTRSLMQYQNEEKDRDWEVMVINLNLAELNLEIGNLNKAEEFCEIALPIAQLLKDTERLALIYGIMGGICLRSNELQEAEKYLKNAYSMMVSVKRLDAQADALTDLAKVYEVSGDSQNAIKLLDQAIQIYLQLGIKYKVKNVKALLQELKS